ncbi:acyltransferase family protein [Atopobium sp. oral taxon 810]|uniref:acyltransferase family protein n=1 Tax=Atopobium sp. oral taxon 810 TaxID=712158 RepID=UPI000413F658|nr:acyltransferase family protein [Atopobium sp. oral taxon 810]
MNQRMEPDYSRGNSSRSSNNRRAHTPRRSVREAEELRRARRNVRQQEHRGLFGHTGAGRSEHAAQAKQAARDLHREERLSARQTRGAATPAMSNSATPYSGGRNAASRNKGRRIDALDGLRAICALAVIAYHMGIKWMSGGLLGVTILFVLSGYLATDSVMSEFARNKGRFDIKAYFLRRVRRLMPQAILCIVVTAALCTLFNHILLTKMRPDVIPSLLMVLNWSKILTKVSYFAAAGAPSPLTHYWSLAIEWQFFLVWPPLLYLLMRCHVPKRHIRIGLLVLAAISTALMAFLYTPGADPSRAYYGTDTRAMSLLLGCWLAFKLPLRQTAAVVAEGKNRQIAEAAGALSIAALLVMLVFTEGYTSFSYYGGVALASVVSVIAIAALLPSGTIISKLLSLPPFVWLGQRSYALYLWHYPIVLLFSNFNSTSGTPWWSYVLQLALTLLAADLTYRFVEQPLSKKGTLTTTIANFFDELRERGAALAFKQRVLIIVPATLTLLIAVFGLALVPAADAAGGKPGEDHVAAASLRTPTADGVYDVVLVGDSVPLDAYDKLAEVFPKGLIDCKISRQMDAGIKVLKGYIDQGVVGDTVVSCLGSNGALKEAELDQLLELVGDRRTLWLVNNRMKDNWQDANNQLISKFAEAHDNVNVIDWYDHSKGHDNWVWQDGEHVTPEGAAAYAQLIKKSMNYETPTKENTTYSTLVVGDTVALDATDELAAAFPQGAIDCAEGRSSKSTHETIASYLKKKVVGPNVVIAIGAESVLVKSDLENTIDELGSDCKIWLVSVRSTGPWQDGNNKLLKELADSHNNVKLIDWYKASAGHDEYFAGDGANLSKKGAKAYAKLVSDAVGDTVEADKNDVSSGDAAHTDLDDSTAGDVVAGTQKS